MPFIEFAEKDQPHLASRILLKKFTMLREMPTTLPPPWSSDDAAVMQVLTSGTKDLPTAANALEFLVRHESALLPYLAPNIAVLGDREPSILHRIVCAGLGEQALVALADAFREIGRSDLASQFSAERYRRQPGRQDWLIDHVRDLEQAGMDARGFLVRALQSYPIVTEILKAGPSRYLALLSARLQVGLPSTPVIFPGSTLFFRNRHEILAIVQRIEGVLSKKGQARVHVAGDSCGVDSNSLLIALHLRGLMDRVDLIASDIDDESIEFAARGSYPAAMMTGVEPHILSLYFRAEDGHFLLDPEISSCVQRKRFDVTADSHPLCDVILFQNALPHMTRSMQRRVLRRLKLDLVRGGSVFLGGFMDPAITQMALDMDFRAIEENCLERYEGWSVQRKAWSLANRPYWALPPGGVARPALYCSSFVKAR